MLRYILICIVSILLALSAWNSLSRNEKSRGGNTEPSSNRLAPRPSHSTMTDSGIIKVSKYDLIDSKFSPDEINRYEELLSQFRKEQKEYWTFEIVPDFFKQSNEDTNPEEFESFKEHFGRVHSWSETFAKLESLNKDSAENVKYKIAFLARHGQGFHNLAHLKYGNDRWNDYYSKLNGDGEIVWGPDPELTQLGKNQALENGKQWKKEIADGCQPPTAWVVSPLSRSIDTLILTWGDKIDLHRAQPIIKENIREMMGVHTCDKRSSKSIISAKYSSRGFQIEDGFAEEDIYWQPDYRESVAEHSIRVNKIFQYVFDLDDQTIGITSHSGSIVASLLVLGHRKFPVGTGGMIPVFIKGTKVLSPNLL